MNAASVPDPRSHCHTQGPTCRRSLFANKNVWKRIAVVAAGPAANVIFTFLILYALLLGYGRYTIAPTIDEVAVGSVAEQAGLIRGDRIVEVDGFGVRGFEDFQRLIATSPERPVTIVLERSRQNPNHCGHPNR
jgi:regulator of sigma E protease